MKRKFGIVSKSPEILCPSLSANFCFVFYVFSITPIVNNNKTLAVITLIFQKSTLDQALKSSDTELGPQWKDQKSSYRVRQNLELFRKLVALVLG